MGQLLKAVEQAVLNEQDSFVYDGYDLNRIYGGMNGIIYRANDWCVKIRKRDERNRALREYRTLQALDGLSVAPEALGYYPDLDLFPGDVVISTWVDGLVLDDLSDAPFDVWERILTTLSAIHRVTPSDAPEITDAILPARSTDDIIAEIDNRYAMLSDGQLGHVTKADIGRLWEKIKADTKPYYADSDGLIVCDVTPSNMIDTGDEILIVDWENAGWGDPAIDLADLLVRPNCSNLSEDMRMRILSAYAHEDSSVIERILVYERLLQVFWFIISSRGFGNNQPKRFKGTHQYPLEFRLNQQQMYLERIS